MRFIGVESITPAATVVPFALMPRMFTPFTLVPFALAPFTGTPSIVIAAIGHLLRHGAVITFVVKIVLRCTTCPIASISSPP